VLAALALMHLIALHDSAGSGNPLGVSGNYDRLPFAPYFIFKDLITIFIFILVLSVFVFFMPNILGDSENYVMANPMQTPPAIVPEWYLLPFYAILRSIPNKLLGVIAMFSAILILLAMPFTDLSRYRGLQFRPLSKIAFFIFVGNFLILMQLGGKHVESPFIEFGQISTVIYFAHFLIIVPLISLLENSLIELASIENDRTNKEIEIVMKEFKISGFDHNNLYWCVVFSVALVQFIEELFGISLDDYIIPWVKCDAPRPWGIYFQDSATPQMEGIVELHDNILFYLVIILFGVGWMLVTIIKDYTNTESPISHKYLSHGTNVPTRKFSKFKCVCNNPLNYKVFTTIRTYSSSPEKKGSIPVKVYEDTYVMKNVILKENIGKSGIYMWTNKLTGDIYVGQSSDISKRFKNYFNVSYIKSKKGFIISRALIKYGYSNFSLTILEYCNISDLLIREQYYFYKLKPQNNILKIAGSSLGFIHSDETKAKISKSLKGIYLGDKSALFGRLHKEETRELMSLKKVGENNPSHGKIHSEKTKYLMRQKALGRKHLDETKLKMSTKHGNPVNIYEKCSLPSAQEEFKLIGCFVSARRAAKFLEMSGSTVIRYMNSGAIFKDRYKFSSK